MKKTAISLLLALVMVFSLVLVAAPAAQAADHTNHCVCGGKASGVGDHKCKDEALWIDLNAIDGVADKYALTTGNYYLSADLKLNGRFTIAGSATVTVCLNGYKLYSETASTDGRLFAMNTANITLNICDCKGTGQLSTTTESHGAIVWMYKYTGIVLNMYGGTATASGACVKAGGAIRQEAASGTSYDATFNMYGGVIQSGSGSNGGNVGIYDKFNMYGGTIKGGTASAKGANLFINGTEANIYDGTITGGTAGAATCDIYVNPGKTLTVHNLDASATVYIENEETSVVKVEGKAVTLGGSGNNLTLKKNSANPGTGDSANLVVMGLGLVLGVAGMACLLPKKQSV